LKIAQFCTALLALVFWPATTYPAELPHPQCPWKNPENSWRDYVSGNVPKSRTRKGIRANYFMVKFDKMSKLPDSKLKGLRKNSCYTVYYSKGIWHTAGYNKHKKESMSARSKNADPLENQLSLWGVVLTYNEGGEVFHPELGHIGTLQCILTAC
jgi:hypothetical protein